MRFRKLKSKKGISVASFFHGNVSYSRYKGYYGIRLHMPMLLKGYVDIDINRWIYKSKKRPIFRDIVLIHLLTIIPLYLISFIIHLIVFTYSIVIICIKGF